MVAGPKRKVIYFAPELYSSKLIFKTFKKIMITALAVMIGGSFLSHLKRVKNFAK